MSLYSSFLCIYLFMTSLYSSFFMYIFVYDIIIFVLFLYDWVLFIVDFFLRTPLYISSYYDVILLVIITACLVVSSPVLYSFPSLSAYGRRFSVERLGASRGYVLFSSTFSLPVVSHLIAMFAVVSAVPSDFVSVFPSGFVPSVSVFMTPLGLV